MLNADFIYRMTIFTVPFNPGSYLITVFKDECSGLLILLWYYPHVNHCLVCRQICASS